MDKEPRSIVEFLGEIEDPRRDNANSSIPELFSLDTQPMTAIRELSHGNEARASAPFSLDLARPYVSSTPAAAAPTSARCETPPTPTGVVRH